MSSEFDDDTAVTEQAPGRYAGTITGRWNVGPVPNGGYLLAIAQRAIGLAIPGRDPLTSSAHYLRPAVPGPVSIEVETIKQGKSLATASARLLQGGREITRVLATVGSLDARGAPRFMDGGPPALPAVADALLPPGPPPVEIARRFEQRYDPATLAWAIHGRAEVPAHAELRAYQRFADGRAPDVLSLPLFADSMPPPVFAVLAPGWVPTVELTVHVRARPVPGWLRCRFSTRFVAGGLLEEDGELWDEGGQLVAQSRQLAAVPSRKW